MGHSFFWGCSPSDYSSTNFRERTNGTKTKEQLYTEIGRLGKDEDN